MTTFLLVRHADCDPVGKSISGRAPGVHLNETGRAQSAALADRVRGVALDAIYTSPLERSRETALALATGRGLEIQELEGVSELDFGEWTGSALSELDRDQQWARFNALRSVTRIPGGELMLEVQARAVSALSEIVDEFPTGRVAVITHGDVIRGLVSHYAGAPLDLFQRLEIAPASVSVVTITPDWVCVRCVNVGPQLPI